MVQGTEHPVAVEERSMRATLDDRPRFSAECQTEKQGLATGITSHYYMNLNLKRQMKYFYGIHENRQKTEVKYYKRKEIL